MFSLGNERRYWCWGHPYPLNRNFKRILYRYLRPLLLSCHQYFRGFIYSAWSTSSITFLPPCCDASSRSPPYCGTSTKKPKASSMWEDGIRFVILFSAKGNFVNNYRFEERRDWARGIWTYSVGSVSFLGSVQLAIFFKSLDSRKRIDLFVCGASWLGDMGSWRRPPARSGRGSSSLGQISYYLTTSHHSEWIFWEDD